MDPIQLPEDLSSLSDDQVAELRSTAIPAFAAHLASQVQAARDAGEALSADLTASISTLTSQKEAVDAEFARRADAPAEDAASDDDGDSFAAADDALAALSVAPEAPAAPAEPAVETPAEAPAPAAALSAEQISSIAAQAATAAVQALDARETPAEAPAAEVVETPAEPETRPAVAAAAVPGGPAALTAARPAAVAPDAGGQQAPREFMRASKYVLGNEVKPGQDLNDRFAVATAMNETLNQLQRSQPAAGHREFVPVAQASWEGEHKITADPIESLLPMTLGVASAQQSLVAAGVCCTPLSPMYDFCRLATPQNPVESCLPSVMAPRGGIRHLVTPDWRQAFAAVDEQCCGDNDDPDNPVLKACSRVECPELEDCLVCAVSWCAEFDNLQSRTFPELIDNYMEDLAVAYAIRKEVHYLDYIHNASTAVTGVETGYGALRQFIYNLGLAAVGYRKRNRMADGALLSAMVPSWVRDVIKADSALQADRNGASICMSDAEVNAAFTCVGISPCWYVDSATGQDMAFDTAQAAGDINAWPDEALVYLFSPGTFVRLDGGTLDVGLIRDSQLTRRNDFQMFYEEWIGMCQLCPESVALTVPFCVNGAVPEAVAALTC